MQESEKKTPENERPRGRHAAPKPEEPASPALDATDAAKDSAAEAAEEALSEDYDLLGDESEIPLRRKKKAAKKDASFKTAKGKKAAKKKAGASKKQARKILNAVPPLFSDKKFRRKKSLFEIMSATDEDGLFKPLRIFSHEIRFWPLFVLALVAMLVGVVVMSNGNVTALTEQVTVVGLPSDLENYGILVLSDLNGKRFGDQQSVLVRAVESQSYNIILCVGDMVGSDGDPEPFYEFLEGLSHPERVYFVAGDADPGPYVEVARDIQGTLAQIVLEDWILGAIERGANYVDAPVRVSVGDSSIWLTPNTFLNVEAISYREEWKDQMQQEEEGTISGLTSDYNSLPFTSYRYTLAQKFYEAANSISSTDLLICMSHIVPSDGFIESTALHDSDDGLYLSEPELIVSGHYCGGVWKIPGLGAFYAPNRMLPRYGWFPAKEDVNGLSKVGESQVYLTGGLSTNSDLPLLFFRAFNDPEITLLTLTAKLPENMLESAVWTNK